MMASTSCTREWWICSILFMKSPAVLSEISFICLLDPVHGCHIWKLNYFVLTHIEQSATKSLEWHQKYIATVALQTVRAKMILLKSQGLHQT
jgi:hypothetical protein